MIQFGTALKSTLFALVPSPPITVLRRMVAAARKAEGMPPGARRWLAD
jgi:threonine/homoserine efflux transporter RhtA